MKREIITAIIIILFLVGAAAGLAYMTTPHQEDPGVRPDGELTVCEDVVIGDAQYRITYKLVGGTPDNPCYEIVVEVIGDEPLIIEGGSILGGG